MSILPRTLIYKLNASRICYAFMIFNNLKLLKYSALRILLILTFIIIAIVPFNKIQREPERSETIPTEIKIIPIYSDVLLRDSIVDFGMNFLNAPYVYGASRKDGFDCSGFVYFVFQHFRIKVPRSSSQYENFGKEIPVDSVRKGDILVFLSPTRNVIGHLGIVINPKGMESDFIHASSGKEMKVIITSLKKDGYKRRFVKALDVL
jgi:hypothetical protein